MLKTIPRPVLVVLVLTSVFSISACAKKKIEPPSPVQQFSNYLPNEGFYNNAESTPIYGMIDGAQVTLDIEIYQMSDRDVRKALRKALERGVRIRVIKEPDPLGDRCKIFEKIQESDEPDCVDQKNLKTEIITRGGEYVPFNKNELCGVSVQYCFMHGKMVISDQKAVLISTGNFNSSNLCNLSLNPTKCNRDFTMIEKDPEVIEFLSTVFENDLKQTRYDLEPLLAQGQISKKVTVSPYSLDPLVKLIERAKHVIRIENQYLNTDKRNLDRFNNALKTASRRGVKVQVTLASLCSFSRPDERAARIATEHFTAFEEANISVRLFPAQFKINGKPGYLHAKAIVIDDSEAWVGSVNGSWSATSNNREFGLFFSTPDWVTPLVNLLKSDHASEDTETWKESLDCKKDWVEIARH